jgi:hypothetical protein
LRPLSQKQNNRKKVIWKVVTWYTRKNLVVFHI